MAVEVVRQAAELDKTRTENLAILVGNRVGEIVARAMGAS